LGRDSKILEASAPTSGGRVKYTDIRGKFSHLFDKQNTSGGENQPDAGVKRVNRSLFGSAEPSSPAEDQSFDSDKTTSTPSFKSNPLVGTPVVDNDPLGALRTPPETSPSTPAAVKGGGDDSHLPKSATLPTAEKGKPGDDILGN
jgi:hypothetical protein